MQLEAALVVPVGWKVSPEIARLTVPANADRREGFTVTIPENWNHSQRRVALAVDVMADGKYLGEIAEGIVDLAFPGL